MSSVYLNPSSSSSFPIPNLACQTLNENPNYYFDDQSFLPIEFSSHAQDLKVESNSNDFGKGDECGFSYGDCNPISNQGELKGEIGDNGIIKNSSDHKNSKKWKPSKVRIMQKMLATSKQDKHNLDQGQRKLYNNNNNNNNNNGVIRTCSDCHTTTTPLWRSGPQGPKSLCNACGIRQRKARRASMAEATLTTAKSRKPWIHEEMGERGVNLLPLKKRGKRILHGDDKYGLSSRNNKDFLTTSYNYHYYSKKQALPMDEEEGAILLMALSCGLCSS